MANITQINVNGTTYDLKDNISGYTTAYDGTTTSDTKYDALFLETLASGVNTVKVGLDMDLLWTNSAPTSSFSAQTVSVDLSDYQIIIISFRLDNSTNANIFTNVCLEKTVYTANSPGQPTSSQAQIWRTYTISNGGIAFNDGGAGSSQNNQYCIPTAIYGIR